MSERSERPSVGEPFPLARLFRRRFAPALVGFVGVFLLITGLTARQVIEAIYLELAQRRAQTIERSVAESSPRAWAALMAGRALAELRRSEDASELTLAFGAEVRQQRLLELKVYDLGRRVLYASDPEEIGTTEDGDALKEVIADGDPGLVTKTLADGTRQYELYVPVFDEDGAMRAVFELYEPVDYLNGILVTASIPILAIPGLLFLLLGVTLDRLVSRAQTDIDNRSELIDELRRRLESFVSSTAAAAARNVAQGEEIPSERIETTLFFSDIRDFTGFSEEHSPEEVVAFLNAIMSLQVGIVRTHGGDVDKMIGDAVLARFDGPDGPARAIAAAGEIQCAVSAGSFPRQLGIGIYEGPVILGTIGPDDRRDFTVIGDSVNVTARLCAEARSGEIVVDARLAGEGFCPPETVAVRGRDRPVAICRRRHTV